jgi:hypothetical protein
MELIPSLEDMELYQELKNSIYRIGYFVILFLLPVTFVEDMELVPSLEDMELIPSLEDMELIQSLPRQWQVAVQF